MYQDIISRHRAYLDSFKIISLFISLSSVEGL
jgi:hypothetical protein